MSLRRALVDCAVLSLQDTCVFYPCCKDCFSRIHTQANTARCRCSKCGYTCLKQHVDYRYRLSLRVTRNSHIFGMTVFGSCLNPLFGIPASGLQRLVEDSEGLRGAQDTLLIKAVEDCFVGRHFVFGIKVSPTDRLVSSLSGPHTHPPLLGFSKETGQFIASQIILPNASAPGCSVISYYKALLQQAAVCTDTNTVPQPPASPLRLHHSPLSSFNNTLPSCGHSQSLSLHHDQTLTPTAPWQQSLGLVTSSAEQEEGCSFDDSRGDLTGRQRDSQCWSTPGDVPVKSSVCEEGRGEGREEQVTSYTSTCGPRRQVRERNSFWNVLSSFSDSPDSPVHRSASHSPATLSWPGHPESQHTGNVPSSTRVRGTSDKEKHLVVDNRPLCAPEALSVCEQSTDSPDSVAWEDLPFSESLGMFVCEAAEGLATSPKTESNLMIRNLEKSTSQTSHGCSHAKTSSNESHVTCSHINTLSTYTDSHRTLPDTTNTSQINYGDISLHSDNQTCSDLRMTLRNDFGPPGCEREGDVVSVSVEKYEGGKEQIRSFDPEDKYNCSADLFHCSQISMTAHMPDTHTHPHPPHTSTQPRSDAHSLNANDISALEHSECSHSLDFVPFSQSTPIAKRGHTRTPWKMAPRHYVVTQQCLRLGKRILKGPLERRRDSLSVRDMNTSVCDDDTELVPPTNRARCSVTPRQIKGSVRDDCKRTLLDRRTTPQRLLSGLTHRQRGNYGGLDCEEPGNCEGKGFTKSTSVEEGSLCRSVSHSLHDGSEACDFSRDLFSDSF